MNPGTPPRGAPPGWAAVLFAVDPVGLGGVALRSGAGAPRDAWLARLTALLPADAPWRKVPLHADDDRLLGGLDLTATLRRGSPVTQRGLLAEAHEGVLVLAMAERMTAATAARLAAVLDTGELTVERHGVGLSSPSRVGLVALDEGVDGEHPPARLTERLAFWVELDPSGRSDAGDDPEPGRVDVELARSRLATVTLGDDIVAGLCTAALALGIDSVRAPLLACRAARAIAALDGAASAEPAHAALAASLVLAPRATRLPVANAAPDDADAAADTEADPDADAADADDPPAPEDTPDSEPAPPPAAGEPDADADAARDPPAAVPDASIEDLVLAAALASIPPGLLAALTAGRSQTLRAPAGSGAGLAQLGRSRGRPVGVRRGDPQRGARLNLIETLRAAAPWQPLRRREAAAAGEPTGAPPARVLIRREDFHIWRFQQRSETTTVFVVDASGSSALHRLAEAKGAVELLLADCYVRRDSVAVIAFRGPRAELLLPPTRSLVRAKRSLAGLPGGGGTPLAAALAAAIELATAIRRRGATPVVVLLTDGKANIALDGSAGRQRAAEDARLCARQWRASGMSALLLDTSPQPQPTAQELALLMGARYLPLPHAGAALLSQAVRAASAAPSP